MVINKQEIMQTYARHEGDTGSPEVQIALLNARITAGEPQLLEHEALRWITPAEIPEYEFCPADEAILARLRGAAE